MRDGIYIVDGDGHVMDFPHRCYQKYLPEQYRRRIAFFPGAQWDRRQAPNGDLGRDPNTPHEMMSDMAQEGIDLAFLYPTSALRIGEIREVDYQTADGEFEKRPWDAPLCRAKPSEYMTCGRAYFSCEPEEKTIPYVIGWVGEDNILYASDYPHWDSEWPHTVDELMKRDDLNARVKTKILGQNALRFYDLKAPLSR